MGESAGEPQSERAHHKGMIETYLILLQKIVPVDFVCLLVGLYAPKAIISTTAGGMCDDNQA